MEKHNIKVTIDHHDSVVTKRLNFGPKKSYLLICIATVLAFMISAFSIIQVIFHYSPLTNTPLNSGFEIINTSHKSATNHSQVTIDIYGIDPCSNFHEFACQDWKQKNPEPRFQTQWTVFIVQHHKLKRLAIDILDEPTQDDDIDAIIQAKSLYRKCLIEMESVLGGDLGDTGYPETKEVCMYLIKNTFNIAIAHKMAVLKFGERAQLENIRTEVHQMFENIRQGFNRLDERFLSNSVEETKLCVGLPDWIFNRTRVQAEYDQLVFDTNDTYDHQLMAAYRWERKLSAEKKLEPNSECPWTDYLGNNGAYFRKTSNLIYLPLAFLEPAYFSQNQSEAQKYGSMGSILGHELAHSYLKSNECIIDNSTLKCIQKQYNSFSEEIAQNQHTSLSQNRVLHENVADNLGLLVATNVYSRLRTLQSGISATNPNWDKNITTGHHADEQLLFLSFAQQFCEFPSKQMSEDEHCSGVSRVLGTLQNSHEFAKVWNCPIGSPMNPTPSQHKKCEFV